MDPYLKEREFNTDVSGTASFAAGDSTDVALVSGKTGWSIFVQKIHATIQTDAAQTLTFEDTEATAVFVEKTDSSPGANTQYIWDFGPKGRQLTVGKDFQMDFSAAGLAGHVQFLAYMKQTGVEYLRAPGVVGTGQVFQ